VNASSWWHDARVDEPASVVTDAVPSWNRIEDYSWLLAIAERSDDEREP
jgi:hypothetical protein